MTSESRQIPTIGTGGNPVCYLTVATIPSTTAHASFVLNLAQSLRVAGRTIDVVKVGWKRKSKESFPVFGLAPRVPSPSLRAGLQALLFPLLQIRRRYGLTITHNALTAAAARIVGAPFIFDVHAVPGRGRILRFALSGRACRALAFNSVGARIAFQKAGLGVGKPDKVIGNGSSPFAADLDVRRREREELGYGDTTKLVVYIGSLGQGRGIDVVRAAIGKLNDAQIQLLIVGGKREDVDRERSLVDADGLGDRISFMGHVPQERVSNLMNAADVLLVSYSRSIATVDVMNPMKAHEYLSTDRPIVYPRLARVMDVIGEDPGSVGFEADNPDSLATALQEGVSLFDRRALENHRKGRRITWERVAEMYLDLIEEATEVRA
jgi:glycosyltransferase involved in cell wall biosynthesis